MTTSKNFNLYVRRVPGKIRTPTTPAHHIVRWHRPPHPRAAYLEVSVTSTAGTKSMKRDLYAEVSARIVAELEACAAPWIKPWSATAGMNVPCNAVSSRPYSGCNVVLLWMAQAAGYRTPRFLTFKQALELGGNVRKGEHGSKVYFVKQLQVRDTGANDETATRLIPMLREYTVFNVDQCEQLPARITAPTNVKLRDKDERDATVDEFQIFRAPRPRLDIYPSGPPPRDAPRTSK
jgi:antirestriction protein ArdC